METHYRDITFLNIRNALVLEVSHYILKHSQLRSYWKYLLQTIILSPLGLDSQIALLLSL
jgi:hypothetical protein